jgi:uncharacterized membrane protein
MSGTIVAFLSASCYSLSYVLLHKGHAKSETSDNGLFPVLFIGCIVLGIGALYKFLLDPHTTGLWSTTEQEIGYAYSALSGLIGVFLGRMSIYAAIRRLGATRGIVIESLDTVVTLFLAITFLGESLDSNDILGIIALVSGITLLLLERTLFKQRAIVNPGVILGITGAVLQGFGHFFRKLGMMSAVVPIYAATLDIWVAFIGYVIFLKCIGRLRYYIHHYVRIPNLYIVAAGVTSAAGILLFYSALGTAPLSAIVVITGFEPILVALFSKLLFPDLEHMTWMTAIYTVLVAAGIVLLQAT